MSLNQDSLAIDIPSQTDFDFVGHEVTVAHSEERGERVLCQVKWFNDRLGYGFLTELSALRHGEVVETGTEHDIFVYMDAIKPKISSYKTLYTGEYVEITKVAAPDGRFQAKEVTGPQNNCLLVDFGRIRYIAYYKAHFRGSEPRFTSNFDADYAPPNPPRRRRRKKRRAPERVVTSILSHDDDDAGVDPSEV